MEIASVFLKTADLLLKITSSPTAKDIQSIWKYESEIKRFADTVSMIGDVLSDMEAKRFQVKSVERGYKRLREAYLDAEDFLDAVEAHRKKLEAVTSKFKKENEEMMNKANSKRKQLLGHVRIKKKAISIKIRHFFSGSNPVKHAVKMHNAIKEIRRNLNEIEMDMKKFKIKEPSITSETTDLTIYRATGPCVDAENIVGRGEDKEKLVGLLLGSSADPHKIPVISIVGIGGLGKTTTAQLLYDDESWQKSCKFDLKLWVPDSKKFDVKSMLKNILKSIFRSGTSLDSLDENHLRERLVEEIGGKKFLLVLDDVENEDVLIWENLESLLNHGNKEESRILVTTRSRKVADVMGSDSPYELRGLSETDALQLFERYAFRRRRDEDLVEIGKHVVNKCVGVPLAIKVIGSLLCGEDKRMWERVRRDIGLTIKDDSKSIIPILMISYYNLDSTLKQCFSYCALFPKNYYIRVEILSSIWKANVRSQNGKETLEDDCEKYLKTLCDRGLVERSYDDGYFKMHDLIHDLATKVAGEEMLMMNSNTKMNSNKFILEENIRHVSLMGHVIKADGTLAFEVKGRRLRTFILPETPSFETLEMKYGVDELVLDCPALRLLAMNSLGIKNLPNSVGKLIHLRYLNLSGNEFHTLPNSIVELINLCHLNLAYCKALIDIPSRIDALTSLEWLDLFQCEKLKELPKGIAKLENLEYLRIEGCKALTHLPYGMGALTSLCNLDKFIVGDSESNDTAQLEELGCFLESIQSTLKIELPSKMRLKESWDGETFLLNKKRLSGLEIRWQGNGKEEVPSNHMGILATLQPPPNLMQFTLDGYQGTRFPLWVPSDCFASVMPNLTEICISNCGKCQQLPPLSRLGRLERLKLRGLSSLEYMEENVSAVLFCPSLERLQLHDLPALKGWYRGLATEDGEQALMLPSFSDLKVLDISGCPNLMVAPILVSFVSGVRKYLKMKIEETHGQSISTPPALYSSFESWFGHVCRNGGRFCLRYVVGSVRLMGTVFSLEIPHLELIISALSTLENPSIKMVEPLKEMLQHVTALQIRNCSGLKTLPARVQHLSALTRLAIQNCCDFTGEEEDGQVSWKDLQSLKELNFTQLRKMVKLPQGIQFLTSLQRLEIKHCDSLLLPEWLHKTFKSHTVPGNPGGYWFDRVKQEEMMVASPASSSKTYSG